MDARGLPKGELSVRDPRPGKRLRLSIDFGVQKAGQAALARYGKPGGFVAMDPRSGEVIGLGSNPSYDPNVFAKGISPSVYKRLQDPDNGAPLANRATQGLYPTGSTFKLITAVAGARERADQPGDRAVRRRLADGRRRDLQERRRACRTARVALPRALQVSSDVFFYRVGLMADQKGGEVIQKWARPPRARPRDRDRPSRRGRRPGADAGVAQPPVPRATSPTGPGARATTSTWPSGQGDLQANPLQMAVAYSAVANGGRIVTPHIGLRVEDNEGRILQQIEPGARRRLDISSSTRVGDHVRACGRRRTTPGGTSTPVFEGFPITVAGKTGTAERGAQGDQSWYVVAAPYDDPRIVVAVTIERGGFGAEAAAPAARRILAATSGSRARRRSARPGRRRTDGRARAAHPSGPACSASPSRARGSCGSTS